MAQSSGPFDPADPQNPTPSEVLAQAQWALMFEFLVDGVLSADDLVAAPSDSVVRGVELGTGYALAAGHWYHNDSTLTVASTANSASAERVDRLVLRVDRVNRAVAATVIEGTPGQGPPALTLTDTVQDRTLWRWVVPPGATSVTGLVDERHFRPDLVRVCAQDPVPRLRKIGDLWYNRTEGKLKLWDGSAAHTIGPKGVSAGNLPLASGWVADSACTVYRDDQQVYVTVNAKWNGANLTFSQTQGRVLAVLPAGFRPSARRGCTLVLSEGIFCQLHIQTNGEMEIWHPNTGLKKGAVIRETIVYNI